MGDPVSNTYRALTPFAEVLYQPGTFDRSFTSSEEKDALDGGHLEIVPRPYKVLSNNYSAGEQNDVVELALLVDHEKALIQGGHLERFEPELPEPPEGDADQAEPPVKPRPKPRGGDS